MLYHLFYELLSADISGLNVFRYLTFRSVGAALTALLIAFIAGPWLIRELEDRQIGQTIREDTPDRHQGKRGTPTMGGVLILAAVVISTPPIVGVPRFSWWRSGVSSRIVWPICRSSSSRISHGPAMKAIKSAVSAAPTLRNVR